MTASNPVQFVDKMGRRVGNEVVLIASGQSEQPLLTDTITGALATIDVVHHEIHEGEAFHGEYSASVNNGANLDIRLRPGAGGAHITIEINVGGQSTLYLYEAATISNGTTVTAYNFNRNNTTTTAPFQMWHTPTVTATGTAALIPGRLLAGGTTPQTRAGTGSRPGLEWILKPNTEYLIRVNNSSGASVIIGVGVDGYEA